MKTKVFVAVVFALFLAGCAKTETPEVVFRPYMPEPPTELMKEPATPRTIIPAESSAPTT